MNLSLPYILTFFLVTLRMGGLFMLVPPFGGNFIPGQIRVLLVMAITILIVPLISPLEAANISILQLAFLGLGELLVGVFLGISVRALFAIIELAGEIISRNMGLMMAQQFDPASGSNTNLIGVILFYFGTILFFIIGGHHQVILSLVKSYAVIGIAKESLSIGGVSNLITIISQTFSLAVAIGAPFIAVNFIITLGFGVLGKVAPKINVMLISFSFRILGGLLVFTITANLIFNFLLYYTEAIPKRMLELLLF